MDKGERVKPKKRAVDIDSEYEEPSNESSFASSSEKKAKTNKKKPVQIEVTPVNNKKKHGTNEKLIRSTSTMVDSDDKKRSREVAGAFNDEPVYID